MTRWCQRRVLMQDFFSRDHMRMRPDLLALSWWESFGVADLTNSDNAWATKMAVECR
jgi:hypothetical protein